MSRAVSVIPRGPRRSAAARPGPIVLECPAISPEWRFRAFVALVKPQFKFGIAHRDGRQRLPRGARLTVRRVVEASGCRFVATPVVRFPPPATGRLLQITFDPRDDRRARTLARALSGAFPSLWLTFGRHLLHDGRFYRRQGRYRLVPVTTRVPRLPRDLYLAMVRTPDAPTDPDRSRDRPNQHAQ